MAPRSKSLMASLKKGRKETQRVKVTWADSKANTNNTHLCKTSKSSETGKTPSPVELHPFDVLLGRRDVEVAMRPGNKRFHRLVKAHEDEYSSLKRQYKREFAENIIHMLNNMNPPSRFVREFDTTSYAATAADGSDAKNSDRVNALVYVVPMAVAIKKTSSALRARKNIWWTTTTSNTASDVVTTEPLDAARILPNGSDETNAMFLTARTTTTTATTISSGNHLLTTATTTSISTKRAAATTKHIPYRMDNDDLESLPYSSSTSSSSSSSWSSTPGPKKKDAKARRATRPALLKPAARSHSKRRAYANSESANAMRKAPPQRVFAVVVNKPQKDKLNPPSAGDDHQPHPTNNTRVAVDQQRHAETDAHGCRPKKFRRLERMIQDALRQEFELHLATMPPKLAEMHQHLCV